MTNITELRDRMLKIEGGKAEVNVAQMGEVLAKLSDLIHMDASVIVILHKNGKRRSKLRKAAKKL